MEDHLKSHLKNKKDNLNKKSIDIISLVKMETCNQIIDNYISI